MSWHTRTQMQQGSAASVHRCSALHAVDYFYDNCAWRYGATMQWPGHHAATHRPHATHISAAAHAPYVAVINTMHLSHAV